MVTVTLEFETIEMAAAALAGLLTSKSPVVVINSAVDSLVSESPPVVEIAPEKQKPEKVKAKLAPVVEEDEEEEDEEEDEDEEEAPVASPSIKKLAAGLKDTVKLRDAIGYLIEKGGVKDVKAMRKIAAELKPLVPCMDRIDPSTFDERVTNAYKFMESQAN